MKNIRKSSLLLAESFDAWRIIPRTIVLAYGYLVYELYMWFKEIPTYVQEKCDAAVLQIFIDSGVDIERALKLACTAGDVVGGPTAAQSAFVTTIIGLSAGIFGLYTATGRKWERGLPSDLDMGPTWNPDLPDRRRRRKSSEELSTDDSPPMSTPLDTTASNPTPESPVPGSDKK